MERLSTDVTNIKIENKDAWIEQLRAGANTVDSKVVGKTKTYNLNGDVLHEVPWYFEYFGWEAIGTKALLADLKATKAEITAGNIDNVVFNINSPGGMIPLLDEISDEIKSLGVPTKTVVEDMIASAAYYFGSAADKIEISKNAMVGSIGTYIAVHDFSKAYEENGIKAHVISSHELKGAGFRGTEITDAQLNMWQKQVDMLSDNFINVVAANRELPVDSVKELATGEVYFGEDAIARGLADSLLNSVSENGGNSNPVSAKVESPNEAQSVLEETKMPNITDKVNLLIEGAIARGVEMPSNLEALRQLSIAAEDTSILEEILKPANITITSGIDAKELKVTPIPLISEESPENMTQKNFLDVSTDAIKQFGKLRSMYFFNNMGQDVNGKLVALKSDLPKINDRQGYYGNRFMKAGV